jgi:hypothetical protein
VQTKVFPNNASIQNITFHGTTTTAGTAYPAYSSISVFGTYVVYTHRQNPGAYPNFDGTIDVIRNQSNPNIFDYYQNAVYKGSFTPINDIIDLTIYSSNPSFASADGYLYIVYYNYGEYNLNITLNYPENEKVFPQSANLTFNITSDLKVNNLKNITLYIDGLANSTKDITGVINYTEFQISNETFPLGGHNWSVKTGNGIKNSTPDYQYFNIIN